MNGFCKALVIAHLMATGSVAANQTDAPDGAAERGRAVVERLCARCHAVGSEDLSPFSPAPPFRDVAQRYDIDDLAEAFGEGIVVGHPAMPVFEFSPSVIDELLAYLRSLK